MPDHAVLLTASTIMHLEKRHALSRRPLLRSLRADLARRLAEVALVAEQHARRAGPRVPPHLLHPLVDARKALGVGEIAHQHDRVGLAVVTGGDGEVLFLASCESESERDSESDKRRREAGKKCEEQESHPTCIPHLDGHFLRGKHGVLDLKVDGDGRLRLLAEQVARKALQNARLAAARLAHEDDLEVQVAAKDK